MSGTPGAGREGDEKNPLKMKGSGVWDCAGSCFFFSWHHPALLSLLGKAVFSLDGPTRGPGARESRSHPCCWKGSLGLGEWTGLGVTGTLFPYGKPFSGCPRLHALLL